MWGGYSAIRAARAWLRALLMGHEETRRRFEAIQQRTQGKLRVAVNIKLGSYQPHGDQFAEAERCVRIPLEWFSRTCRLLRESADCAFTLVTDGTPEELAPFVAETGAIHSLGEPYVDLLGLLVMMHADLVVCSNSTYSRLACFLNEKPYVWIADTLVSDPSGHYGYLWKRDASPMHGRWKSRGRTAVLRVGLRLR
jgi:hypothetical protein